ncbi:MAG: hypothetical protein ABL940_01840 [Bacteroidia bacterium]
MRYLFLVVTILWVTISPGQTLDKGIYKGQKLPFLICYLTYADSVIEVEYFCQKGQQIFGHIPAKRIQIGFKSFASKQTFKAQDGSITVRSKEDRFLIISKVTGKVRMYKSEDTQTSIIILRNRNKLFSFSQNLWKEHSVKLNFDNEKFWAKLNSYHLDTYLSLDNEKFNTKLDEIRTDFNENCL